MSTSAFLNLGTLPATFFRAGSDCYRIYKYRGSDGQIRTPWYFSSSGDAAPGRFDLPTPKGTCYLNTRKFGAWQEKFRSSNCVARSDVDGMRLLTAKRVSDPLRLANLASTRAFAHGITLDLFSGNDFSASQGLAFEVMRLGFRGVITLARHDTSALAKNIALFGSHGARKKPQGWREDIGELTSDFGLVTELSQHGIAVIEIPHNIPVTPVL